MNKSTLRILVLILLAIVIVGIFAMISNRGKFNVTVSSGNRMSQETLQLLNDMKNDDVIWSGTYVGLLPTELTGASLLLLDVQEDINPLLIDALVDEDKFVAAHVLLTSRTSILIAAPRRGQWNGLSVELDSETGVSFDGNNLFELQKYWREKLQQDSDTRQPWLRSPNLKPSAATWWGGPPPSLPKIRILCLRTGVYHVSSPHIFNVVFGGGAEGGGG